MFLGSSGERVSDRQVLVAGGGEDRWRVPAGPPRQEHDRAPGRRQIGLRSQFINHAYLFAY